MNKALTIFALTFVMFLTATFAIAQDEKEYSCTKEGEDPLIVFASELELWTSEGWSCALYKSE
jgi:hypothetical protein